MRWDFRLKGTTLLLLAKPTCHLLPSKGQCAAVFFTASFSASSGVKWDIPISHSLLARIRRLCDAEDDQYRHAYAQVKGWQGYCSSAALTFLRVDVPIPNLRFGGCTCTGGHNRLSDSPCIRFASEVQVKQRR